MWPFSRRGGRAVGVRGRPVHAGNAEPGAPRNIERHETVVERLGIALAKERHGRRRPDRIAGYEAELRRHLALLAQLRKG